MPNVPFMALSAVPTKAMWTRIISSLKLGWHSGGELHRTASSIRNENIAISVSTKDFAIQSRQGRSTLIQRAFVELRATMVEELRQHGRIHPTIIYVYRVQKSKDTAEDLIKFFNADDEGSSELDFKIDVRAYHGEKERQKKVEKYERETDQQYAERLEAHRALVKKEREERMQTARDFMQGKLPVVVATDAFGMGINHPHVKRIYFFGAPPSIEKFYNQAGRAGRTRSEEAVVKMICKPADFNEHEASIDGNKEATLDAKKRDRSKLYAVRRLFNSTTVCRQVFLQTYWGELNDGEPSINCDKCDNCLYLSECGACDDDAMKVEFGPIAIVCLLLIEMTLEQTCDEWASWTTLFQTDNEGRRTKNIKRIGMENFLKKSTAEEIQTNEASMLRDRLFKQERVWSKPAVYEFLEYLADELEAPLVQRKCEKFTVRDSKGAEVVVVRTKFRLTDDGKRALRIHRAPDANAPKFSLKLHPPLFYRERFDPSKVREVSDTDGESDGATSDEEREDVLPEGQAYIEKPGGKRVYIPEKIVREELLKGKTRYLVRWRAYAPHSKCLCVEGGTKKLEGCPACSWELADKPGPGNHRWRDSLVAEDWKAKRRAELSPEEAAEVEAREQEQMAKERAQAEAVESAAEAVEAAEAAEADALAKSAIRSLPWAIRYAFEALGRSDVDLRTIAKKKEGRAYLHLLSQATSRNQMHDLTLEYFGFDKFKLRVPVPAEGESLVYRIVWKKEDASDKWRISRYEGPHKRVSSKLREFGWANFVEIVLEDPPEIADERAGIPSEQREQREQREQLKLAWLTELRDQLGNDPVEVCGRRFAVFGPRVDLQSEDSRLLLGAIPSDILVRPAASTALGLSVPAGSSSAIPADPATHWSITDPAGSWSGGTTLPRWESMVEMRAFGADFDALSTAEKTTKRLALYFSPSIPYFQDYKWVWKEPPEAASVSALRDAPEGQINVYEWEEIYGIPGDKDSCCMTDGAGQISVDLLLGMPSIDSGRKSDRHDPRQGAPFAVQARLWAHGGLAKGMWVANPYLPKRTILVGKDEQLKVRARPGSCPASLHGTPSFEVLRTMDKVAKAKARTLPAVPARAQRRRAQPGEILGPYPRPPAHRTRQAAAAELQDHRAEAAARNPETRVQQQVWRG